MAAPGEPQRYGCSSPVQSCYCFHARAFANGTVGAHGAWNLVSSSETLAIAVVIAASVLQTISTGKERAAVNLDEAGSVGGAD